ncbi:cytochrome P450 [Frankia torreyi]|uniref:Cytochrome P450 n=2 Tax=Frankia TaxID=1854 RepID=A0A0D8BE06_9ACTN|nr:MULTISPECIES: cytochrome P450 [Frankia]KJE22265.1 cytochrome P450 [Frankia torreyi]
MTPPSHDRVDNWAAAPAATELAVPAPDFPDHPGAVRLYGPRFQHNPAQMYREMRRVHGPVAPILLDGDIPAWLVLGYRELHYVTTNPELYGRDPRRWNAWDRVPPDWPLLPVVGYQPYTMHLEGAEFERRSAIMNDVLGDVDLFELRALCERTCDELIDGFAGRGEADLIAEYAQSMPMLLIGRMIGIPETGLPELLAAMNAATDGSGPEAVAGHSRFVAIINALLADRRARPRPDLPSAMLGHPGKLTDEEASWDLLLIVGIGQQPITDWIGNTLRLMLTDSRFAVTLSGGRRSVGQALNEVLWEDTPLQNMSGRWAVRSTQLAGQHIQAGDMLVLSCAAANGDPQVRPDSFEGPGGNHAHMSFGHGEHRCPYPAQEIAETIVRGAVEVLLDRLPDAVLAVSPDALVWRPSPWMRGLSALPVHFSPS